MASFVPRASFPFLSSLPRSYFLGHHHSGLEKMKTLINQIDLIIECRDYRVPLVSHNPLFEASLAGKERLIVYTKRDLGSNLRKEDVEREETLKQWHHPSTVLFSSVTHKPDLRLILNHAKQRTSQSITGTRMMVVGMPNVGKSTLLNALRNLGTGRGKAAQTGAQPGVTRKIASGVKIVEANEEKGWQDVYLLDTPGVFIPYVPDAESMMKLALCGSVKDTVIPPTMLADYLLFRINLIAPGLYSEYCASTNEVMVLLEAIARKTGRLQKGGVPDEEAAALWMVQRWRTGHLGRFVLDEVDDDTLRRQKMEEEGKQPSLNQARRAEKELRRQRGRERNAVAAA